MQERGGISQQVILPMSFWQILFNLLCGSVLPALLLLFKFLRDLLLEDGSTSVMWIHTLLPYLTAWTGVVAHAVWIGICISRKPDGQSKSAALFTTIFCCCTLICPLYTIEVTDLQGTLEGPADPPHVLLLAVSILMLVLPSVANARETVRAFLVAKPSWRYPVLATMLLFGGLVFVIHPGVHSARAAPTEGQYHARHWIPIIGLGVLNERLQIKRGDVVLRGEARQGRFTSGTDYSIQRVLALEGERVWVRPDSKLESNGAIVGCPPSTALEVPPADEESRVRANQRWNSPWCGRGFIWKYADGELYLRWEHEQRSCVLGPEEVLVGTTSLDYSYGPPLEVVRMDELVARLLFDIPAQPIVCPPVHAKRP